MMTTRLKGHGQPLFFHPLMVLALAALACAGFLVVASRLPNFSGAGKFILYAYHAPIGFAFTVYLFDLARRWRTMRLAQALVTAIVMGLSLLRALATVPFYSGHAFFISYMLLTASSRLAKIVALLVLLDVTWIKVFLLHDATILGGLALGIIAYFLERRIGGKRC